MDAHHIALGSFVFGLVFGFLVLWFLSILIGALIIVTGGILCCIVAKRATPDKIVACDRNPDVKNGSVAVGRAA